MKAIIYGVKEFILPVPMATIDLLIRLSEMHYDAHCRSFSNLASNSAPYSFNGLLQIWKLFGHIPEQPDNDVSLDIRECRATFHDLDTVLKILENRHAVPSFTLVQRCALTTFARALWTLLDKAGKISWKEEVDV